MSGVNHSARNALTTHRAVLQDILNPFLAA